MFRIMKVILSDMCVSLVGTLERGLGYHIERRKNGFFSKKNQRGSAPRDGHWRFIVLCAELAQNHLYISDIEVKSKELGAALKEARIGYLKMLRIPLKDVYNATDILTLKNKIDL